MTSVQDSFQHLPEILDQMPAVTNLNRLRRTFRDPLLIGTRPVASDDFNSWMGLQPFSECLSLPILQQINYFPVFQIRQNRSIPVSSAKRKIINTKAVWCFNRRVRRA